jgi:hypothetical protein
MKWRIIGSGSTMVRIPGGGEKGMVAAVALAWDEEGIFVIAVGGLGGAGTAAGLWRLSGESETEIMVGALAWDERGICVLAIGGCGGGGTAGAEVGPAGALPLEVDQEGGKVRRRGFSWGG